MAKERGTPKQKWNRAKAKQTAKKHPKLKLDPWREKGKRDEDSA